jgi:hypothetical protein
MDRLERRTHAQAASAKRKLTQRRVWVSGWQIRPIRPSDATKPLTDFGASSHRNRDTPLWRNGGLQHFLAGMSDVTRILSQIEQGDPQAAEKLLPLVYDELRKLAAVKLAQENPGQTLQATALVHEAYLRLAAK